MACFESLDPGDLQRQPFKGRRDDARQEIDDQDLRRDRQQPEDKQLVVMLIERAREIVQRRDDKELPMLAELRWQRRQACDVLAAVSWKREQRLAVPRPRA